MMKISAFVPIVRCCGPCATENIVLSTGTANWLRSVGCIYRIYEILRRAIRPFVRYGLTAFQKTNDDCDVVSPTFICQPLLVGCIH